MERAAVLPSLPTILLVVFFFFFDMAVAQLPIPKRYDGFMHPGFQMRYDSILVEAFFDPVCPDSRDSWPPLKQVLSHYHPRLSLIVHPFPLPYHGNAYMACRALHIANKINSSATYPLLEQFFEHQEKYYNAPTKDMTRASIIDDMAQFAAKVIGEKSLPAVKAGYNDSLIDRAARISFKYACSRGVTGTPAFFVNGMPIPDSGLAINYKMWSSIIDPLLQKQ